MTDPNESEAPAGEEPGVAEAARASLAIRRTRRRTQLGMVVALAIFFVSLGVGFVGAYTISPSEAPAPVPVVRTGPDGEVRTRIRDSATQRDIDEARRLRWMILGAAGVLGLIGGAVAYSRLSRPVMEVES